MTDREKRKEAKQARESASRLTDYANRPRINPTVAQEIITATVHLYRYAFLLEEGLKPDGSVKAARS